MTNLQAQYTTTNSLHKVLIYDASFACSEICLTSFCLDTCLFYNILGPVRLVVRAVVTLSNDSVAFNGLFFLEYTVV